MKISRTKKSLVLPGLDFLKFNPCQHAGDPELVKEHAFGFFPDKFASRQLRTRSGEKLKTSMALLSAESRLQFPPVRYQIPGPGQQADDWHQEVRYRL